MMLFIQPRSLTFADFEYIVVCAYLQALLQTLVVLQICLAQMTQASRFPRQFTIVLQTSTLLSDAKPFRESLNAFVSLAV